MALNNVMSSSHLHFPFFNDLQTLGFWSAHGVPLSFVLWIVVELLCSCLCLFDVIVELHVMNRKTFNDFLIGK